MPDTPLKVAWISDFPLEWLPDPPEPLRGLPKLAFASWQIVLMRELAQRAEVKLDVVLLRKQVRTGFSFEREGVNYHIVKVPGGVRGPSLFWVDTLLLRRVLQRLQPDLVHAWGSERGACLVASRLPWPYLVTVQGLMSWLLELTPGNWHERLAAWMERLSLPRAPLVTSESNFSVDYIRKRYPGPVVRQIEHAPHRIFHDLARKPQTAPVRFLAVGLPSYRKGTDLLLRGLARLTAELPFELVVVGRENEQFLGPLRRELPAEFWRRVTFRHSLPPAEVARELAIATALFMPSRADTSPNAAKEAVVAGVPVIGAAVGGIPDYVIPERNGLLFPPGNLEALIASTRALLRHPLFRRGRVEPEIHARMRAYLSPARMGEKFIETYGEAWALQQPR